MLPALLVLFILVPIVELAVIIQVGQLIGVWWTIGLLIAASIAGSLLMRSQSRAAWRRFNDALAAGRAPAREVVDGVLIIFGGALLLTPGFVTDIVGVLLLLPPTRAVLRRVLVHRLGPRLVVAGAGAFGRRRTARPRSPDVEGTASELHRDPRRLP